MISISKRKATSAKIRRIFAIYGPEAEAYFHNHPYCETCGESRLACLGIHHVHGKSISQFEVLCSNCHSLMHAGADGHLTYEELLSRQEKAIKDLQTRRERHERALELLESGLTSLEVSRIVGLHPGSVRKIKSTFKKVNKE